MPEQQTEIDEPIEQDQWLPDSPELPRRPRRRLLTPAPLSLLGVLLIACGFIAGVLVEKGQTSSSGNGSGASSAFASRLSGLRSALGGSGKGTSGTSGTSGGFLGRLGGGGVTVGEVAYVKGGTLYVTNAEGNTVKVSTTEASTVSKTVKAGVKQIHPGETVTVSGEKSASGAIVARSIAVGSGGGLGALLGGATGGSRTGGAGTGGGASGGGQSLFGG